MKTDPIETPKKAKKPKKFKPARKLIWLSLCSLTSGLCFGIGYTIIDHADNTWFQAEEKSSPQAIATSSDRARLSSPSMIPTDKPAADN